MSYTPTYSQGGATGNNSGDPIWIWGATQPVALKIVVTGTPGATITVFAESNGGPVSDQGVPLSTHWIDQSGGGYAVTIPAGGTYPLDKLIPLNGTPAWRTRTVAGAGTTAVSSYVAFIVGANGQWNKAGRPPTASTPSFGY